MSETTTAYQAAYRAGHREERRAYDAAYDASHREERRAYHAAHKEEHRAHNASCYQENRDAILEKRRQEQAEFTEWLQILRTVNGCADEGPHNGRLEHHHVDPSTKKYKISKMSGYSLDALEDELEKCVVLCDAGHKNRHVELRLAESRAVW